MALQGHAQDWLGIAGFCADVLGIGREYHDGIDMGCAELELNCPNTNHYLPPTNYQLLLPMTYHSCHLLLAIVVAITLARTIATTTTTSTTGQQPTAIDNKAPIANQ